MAGDVSVKGALAGLDLARVTTRHLADEIERLRARPCPHVVRADEGTAHCDLANQDIERVQREHRDELARLREVVGAAWFFAEAASRAPEKWLREMPTDAFQHYQRLASLLDQKEQSHD